MRPHQRRRGESGNAIIVIAVSGVTLIAATGLAIDGGMAAGAFRHAQNAADSGALAAVRQEYIDATANPPVATSTSNLTSVANKEVQHNASTPVSVNALGVINSSGTKVTLWVPSSSAGNTASGTFADMSAVLPGVPQSTTYTLTGTDAQSNVKMIPLASGGSQASSTVDVAHDTATTGGTTVSSYANCSSTVASYGVAPTTSSCSTGVFGDPHVTLLGTLVSTANADAHVSSADAPTTFPNVAIVNPSKSISNGPTTYVSVASTLEVTNDKNYWSPDPTVGLVSSTSSSAISVHATTGPVNVDSTALTSTFSINTPPGDHPYIHLTCTATTLTITDNFLNKTYPVPIDRNCAPTTSLPAIAGVTMTAGSVLPSSNYNVACDYKTSTSTWGCPNVTACVLKVQATLPIPVTLCLGEATLSYSATSVDPSSPTNTYVAQFAGAVQVVATLAQPTYFMRVLGFNQTTPTAQAQAAVESVVDESAAAFANSPFAMTTSGTCMGACGGSPGSQEALTSGHQYYLYGPLMQSYNPVAGGMPNTWQGELDSTSLHSVGSTVTGSSGSGTPKPYVTNGSYYLEPIIDTASATVVYYGVFLPVPNKPWGTYTTAIPVQADSLWGWTVLNQGAASVKLEG